MPGPLETIFISQSFYKEAHVPGEPVPDNQALELLASRLNAPIPAKRTAVLLKPGESKYIIPPGVGFSRIENGESTYLTQNPRFPADEPTLYVEVISLEGPDVLTGFARTLLREAQQKRRRAAGKIAGILGLGGGGAVSVVGESVLQNSTMGKIGSAIFTAGVAAIVYVSNTDIRDRPLPNLEGLNSPVQFMPAMEQ